MDNSRGSQGGNEGRLRPPTPQWVKAFGAVGLLLAAAVVVLHLGGHGMGPHMHGAMGSMR